MSQAIKSHEGKPRPELLPVPALRGAAAVFAAGAQKEGRVEYDWTKGTDWGEYTGALMRHMFDFLEGINIDHEDGLPHIDKVLANAMILSTYYHKKLGHDDRPNYDRPLSFATKPEGTTDVSSSTT